MKILSINKLKTIFDVSLSGGIDLDDKGLILNMNIITNNSHPSTKADSTPIVYSEDYNSHYFEIPLFSSQNTRFWINPFPENYSSSIPEYFVYDFFGSGEIYLNVPEGKAITGVKKGFGVMYVAGFINENASLAFYMGETNVTLPCSGTTHETYVDISPNCKHNGEKLLAFSFPIDKYFYLVDSSLTSSSKQAPSPVCEYFTYKDSINSVISPHYSFANVIESYPTCSNKLLCPSKNSPQICSFNASFSSCIGYKPSVKTIKSLEINQFNTNNTILMNLEYYVSSSKEHCFLIKNVSNNETCSTLIYPSTLSYEDVLVEAEQVYSQYISCYTLDSIKESEASEINEVEKSSYILSLLGS